MVFSTDARVRYSEVDSNKLLTPDSLINYFQDCTMLHSETLGVGMEEIRDKGYFWLLSSWQIQIERTPRLFEKLKICTSPYEFKGFFGNRNFWIEDEQGEMIVKANSIWVFLNSKTLKPLRVIDEEINAYMPFEPPIDMDYSSRKIRLPENLEEYPPYIIKYSQIDTNKHVNNCEYLRTVMDVIDRYDMPSKIKIEYRKAAKLGEVFYPFVNKTDKEYIIDLRSDDGSSNAILELTY